MISETFILGHPLTDASARLISNAGRYSPKARPVLSRSNRSGAPALSSRRDLGTPVAGFLARSHMHEPGFMEVDMRGFVSRDSKHVSAYMVRRRPRRRLTVALFSLS